MIALFISAFQAYVVNKFVELKHSVNQMQQMMVNMELGSATVPQNLNCEEDEFEVTFPIQTLEVWEAFDASLRDSEKFGKLVSWHASDTLEKSS